uniref:DNA/RNA non-specific endonuclease domain-containing protein n=1 Tax=Strigamia maritima TaxID=126957 RepID=T1IHF9_STRMM
MANFGLLCLIATGIGCYYANSLDKLKKNAFKVNAQPPRPFTLPRLVKPTVPDPMKSSSLLIHLGRYGIPERDVLLDYSDFEISYDNLNKIPNWVAEHLTFDNLKQSEFSCYQQDAFVDKEERVHENYQSTAEDYNSANVAFITKGFLVNGKNHQHAERSFRQSSKLSNVVPLAQALAQNETWSDLEAFTRFLTSQYHDVYVFSGPIFAPKYCATSNTNFMEYKVIGDGRVAVPTHFFKIIIARSEENLKKLSIGCYVIPNDSSVGNHQMNEYLVPLLELERKAGFKLFEEGFCSYAEDLMTADEFVKDKINIMAEVGLSW